MFVEEHKIADLDGNIWPIATHQFRRTFAVFVAKNLIGDLRYLRHHFKHWSMDMTLHYARHERGDEALISEIISERDRLHRIIVSDWFSNEAPLTGGGGRSVMAFRSRNNVKTAKNIHDAVANLADGLFIRSTGHSWCLSNTECCGGQGLYDSLQCTACDNAIIDQTLLPTWKGIRAHQATVLGLDDIGEPVKHYARQQIEAADQIIQELTNGND